MLDIIANRVRERLTARGVPFPVVYGPERGSGSVTVCRYVIERDRSGSDNLSAGRKVSVNPRMIFVRGLACQCTVYAQSTLDGPRVQDHEDLSDQMVDHFLLALRHVLTAKDTAPPYIAPTTFTITRIHVLSKAELTYEDLEAWPGVVQRVSFVVDRAINDLPWSGETAPVASDTLTCSNTMSTGAGEVTLPSVRTEL